MVKAHPGYSGTIMTATFVLSNLLGWDYFEKLKPRMSCRSSLRPSRRRNLRRASAPEVDGNEYNIFRLQDEGAAIKIVYPDEGMPLRRFVMPLS